MLAKIDNFFGHLMTLLVFRLCGHYGNTKENLVYNILIFKNIYQVTPGIQINTEQAR